MNARTVGEGVSGESFLESDHWVFSHRISQKIARFAMEVKNGTR